MSTSGSVGERLVILGVAESDSHAVANHLIAMQLRDHGFRVVNLGVCTPLHEFANAFDRHPDAEAILIGSLNGHARQDLEGLPALRGAGRLRCPVIVGGNLSVGSNAKDCDELRLYQLGVDHVTSTPNELLLLLDALHAARNPEFQHG